MWWVAGFCCQPLHQISTSQNHQWRNTIQPRDAVHSPRFLVRLRESLYLQRSLYPQRKSFPQCSSPTGVYVTTTKLFTLSHVATNGREPSCSMQTPTRHPSHSPKRAERETRGSSGFKIIFLSEKVKVFSSPNTFPCNPNYSAETVLSPFVLVPFSSHLLRSLQ